MDKPYKPLWWTIPLILGLSIIGYNGIIDIQYHDTYFVIATIHLGYFFSTFLFIIGLIYWLIRKKTLVNWMTLFHVIFTISVFLVIILVSLFHRIFGEEMVSFLVFLLLVLSQVIFLLNLTIGLIRNKPKHKINV
ncbi:MAG: hypothetical protein IPN29_06645 [Saprospiraceae bacterium]|nr:hypothetical protein [Saprospiraceae bacterium]